MSRQQAMQNMVRVRNRSVSNPLPLEGGHIDPAIFNAIISDRKSFAFGGGCTSTLKFNTDMLGTIYESRQQADNVDQRQSSPPPAPLQQPAPPQQPAPDDVNWAGNGQFFYNPGFPMAAPVDAPAYCAQHPFQAFGDTVDLSGTDSSGAGSSPNSHGHSTASAGAGAGAGSGGSPKGKRGQLRRSSTTLAGVASLSLLDSPPAPASPSLIPSQQPCHFLPSASGRSGNSFDNSSGLSVSPRVVTLPPPPPSPPPPSPPYSTSLPPAHLSFPRSAVASHSPPAQGMEGSYSSHSSSTILFATRQSCDYSDPGHDVALSARGSITSSSGAFPANMHQNAQWDQYLSPRGSMAMATVRADSRNSDQGLEHWLQQQQQHQMRQMVKEEEEGKGVRGRGEGSVGM